jgi:hypothetical protein
MAELDLSAAEAAAAESDSSASSAASGVSTPSESHSPSTSAVSSDATQQAASGGAQAAAQTQPWSLRSELSGLGIDANAHADDKAAWTAFRTQLAEQVKQLQQKSQSGDYYLANQQKIAQAQAFYEQHQAKIAQDQQAAQSAGKDPWWKVPDWKPEYERFLARDKSGNIVAIPGADPGLPLKYQAYQDWRAKATDDFLHNPIETLRPGLEEFVKSEAEKLIKQHLGGYQDHELAHRYVHSAPWMFKQDANGQAAINPNTGRQELSDAGRRFAGYVQYAERNLGIRDVQAQAKYAQDQVQLDYLRQHYQKTQADQQQQTQAANQANDQLKNEAIKRGQGGARRLPNSGALGKTAATQVGKPAGQQDINLSLEDRLAGAFRENGIHQVA